MLDLRAHRALLHSDMAKMSSSAEPEELTKSLILIFQRYAGKDGDSYARSQTESLTFMKTELAAFTKNQKDPGILDRMKKKLDINCDGKLD